MGDRGLLRLLGRLHGSFVSQDGEFDQPFLEKRYTGVRDNFIVILGMSLRLLNDELSYRFSVLKGGRYCTVSLGGNTRLTLPCLMLVAVAASIRIAVLAFRLLYYQLH